MKLKSKKNIQTLGKHLEVYPSLDAFFTEEHVGLLRILFRLLVLIWQN